MSQTCGCSHSPEVARQGLDSFPESHLQPTRTPLAWPQRVPTAFLKRAPIPTQREALGRWPGARELHSLREYGSPAVNRLGLGEQQTATNSLGN